MVLPTTISPKCQLAVEQYHLSFKSFVLSADFRSQGKHFYVRLFVLFAGV